MAYGQRPWFSEPFCCPRRFSYCIRWAKAANASAGVQPKCGKPVLKSRRWQVSRHSREPKAKQIYNIGACTVEHPMRRTVAGVASGNGSQSSVGPGHEPTFSFYLPLYNRFTFEYLLSSTHLRVPSTVSAHPLKVRLRVPVHCFRASLSHVTYRLHQLPSIPLCCFCHAPTRSSHCPFHFLYSSYFTVLT